MNCKDCKFKGSIVPGSSHHISCKVLHLSDEGAKLDLLAAAGMIELAVGDEPAVKQNQHGIDNGWCMWPINFDPCWIEDCKFYKIEEI